VNEGAPVLAVGAPDAEGESQSHSTIRGKVERHADMNTGHINFRISPCWVQLSVLGLLLITIPTVAQNSDQKTFSSPKAAVEALFAAAKADDTESLQAIFGPGADDLLSSGDEVADKNARKTFAKRYSEMHVLVANGKDSQSLNVGLDNWPFPIPIVRTGDNWRFDTAAGKQEVLYRRIGTNELGAIRVCRALVDAQREYASRSRDGQPSGAYAAKLVSDAGKKNGLYWKVKAGEPPSPIGPLLAEATAEGYGGSGDKNPYRGYFYRLLAGQGPAAPGGAKSYVIDGKLKAGFAVLAFPANYGSSGIMTFIVNQQGIVYQKDLGENTNQAVLQIKDYNPDSSWTRVH
jgi:hypothetical protein